MQQLKQRLIKRKFYFIPWMKKTSKAREIDILNLSFLRRLFLHNLIISLPLPRL